MRPSFPMLWLLGALLSLSACATMAPPQPPSLELPKPPSDLRAQRKGDKVVLTWTVPKVTTDRQTVRNLGPTHICRGLEPQLTDCGAPVGEAANNAAITSTLQKVAASYTDSLPSEYERDDASASITYAIEVLNTDGRSAGLSNQVRVALIRTVAPPEDLHATVTKDGVELHWSRNVSRTDSEAKVHYVYRVYRRQEGTANWSLSGEIPAGGENDITLTDSNIEWEKTYEYRIETVTLAARNGSEVQVEGNDSAEVKVFADDVFPPAVPAGLQAVSSGPGQTNFVDLVWAPVTDADLAGYNVYRREEDTSPVKINSGLVQTPAYRDASVVSGKSYLYSVSAVDLRGNESPRSEEASETVP